MRMPTQAAREKPTVHAKPDESVHFDPSVGSRGGSPVAASELLPREGAGPRPREVRTISAGGQREPPHSSGVADSLRLTRHALIGMSGRSIGLQCVLTKPPDALPTDIL